MTALLLGPRWAAMRRPSRLRLPRRQGPSPTVSPSAEAWTRATVCPSAEARTRRVVSPIHGGVGPTQRAPGGASITVADEPVDVEQKHDGRETAEVTRSENAGS
eukprot:2532948-Pyramimonas_sp.AAC.1